jgi:hypothetical protein
MEACWAQTATRPRLWDGFDYSAGPFAERVEYRQNNRVL